MSETVSQNFIFPYEPDETVTITEKMIRDYLTARYYAGDTIQIDWDGGNDSGSVNLLINGDMVDIDWWNPSQWTLLDKIHKYLIERFYDVLDYGTWAGDFNASGSAPLMLADGFIGFRGTDWYEDEDPCTESCDITVCIPKECIPPNASKFCFDISGGYDGDEPSVGFGFREEHSHRRIDLPEEHEKIMTQLEENLASTVDKLLENHKVSSVWTNSSIDVVDATQDLVVKIEEIHYYTRSERSRLVLMNLDEE